MPSYGLYIHTLLIKKILNDVPTEKIKEAQKFLDDVLKIAEERNISMEIVSIASILFLSFIEKSYFEEIVKSEGLQDKVVVKKGDEVLFEFSLTKDIAIDILNKINEKLINLNNKELMDCEVYVDGKLNKYWTLLLKFRRAIDLLDLFKNYFYPILFVNIPKTLEISKIPFIKSIIFYVSELIKSDMLTNIEKILLVHSIFDALLSSLVNNLDNEMYNFIIKDIKQKEEIV